LGRWDARWAADVIFAAQTCGRKFRIEAGSRLVTRRVREMMKLGANPAEREAWLAAFQKAVPAVLSPGLRPAGLHTVGTAASLPQPSPVASFR